MTYLRHLSGAKDALAWPPAAQAHPGGPLLTNRLSAIGSWIRDCTQALADYYAVTAAYEQLSRLSDAELHRRGLSHANLARDVLATCDRTARRA